MKLYNENEEKGGELPKLTLDDITLQQFNLAREGDLISNDTSYMSTPFIVKALTNVCEQVLESEDKEKALLEGLNDINSQLPAKVYIPLVRQSARNFTVLRIRTSEAKVFVTKTRAPFLCVMEVYRPEEL